MAFWWHWNHCPHRYPALDLTPSLLKKGLSGRRNSPAVESCYSLHLCWDMPAAGAHPLRPCPALFMGLWG